MEQVIDPHYVLPGDELLVQSMGYMHGLESIFLIQPPLLIHNLKVKVPLDPPLIVAQVTCDGFREAEGVANSWDLFRENYIKGFISAYEFSLYAATSGDLIELLFSLSKDDRFMLTYTFSRLLVISPDAPVPKRNRRVNTALKKVTRWYEQYKSSKGEGEIV